MVSLCIFTNHESLVFLNYKRVRFRENIEYLR